MARSCRHNGDADADMNSGGGRGMAAGAGPERGGYDYALTEAPSSCGAPGVPPLFPARHWSPCESGACVQ